MSGERYVVCVLCVLRLLERSFLLHERLPMARCRALLRVSLCPFIRCIGLIYSTEVCSHLAGAVLVLVLRGLGVDVRRHSYDLLPACEPK